MTRTTVASLDEILEQEFPILDHGFIRLIDYMGDESSIVQAARVSYGSGTKSVNEDKGLIRYLMRHRHTTPLEMCEIKLHVKLPIFVARQWIRHRTANVNEYSARYSILDKEFYIPAPEDIQPQSDNNKQGRSGELTGLEKLAAETEIKLQSDNSYKIYNYLLGEDDHPFPGIARELARMVLPLNYYTQWYWKTNLHNLLHFLSLRCDPHAQKEIRVYADKILEIVKMWLPNVYDAFMDYNMNAITLSYQQKNYINYLLSYADLLKQELEYNKDLGMSKREFEELFQHLSSLNKLKETA